MAYLLVTGATGLLGSSLLGRLLRDARRVAVLLRPGRGETIAQRIEAICSRCEREVGHCLPRPVLLAGDLQQTDLGLGAADVRWIERNCEAVLHCAASLTFTSNTRDKEPWTSNLEGTRHLLDLCRRARLTEFHHVSTAYVCGLREGCILERELEVGQQFANDYEQSKAEAEGLVRRSGFLERTTIYRPSIIVGHSITGHTTTFHGFYTPLKIMLALLGHIDSPEEGGSTYLAALGLTGQERKNFVPVDWVSAVIERILADRRKQGTTYHLTCDRPVATAVVAGAVEDALRWHVAQDGSRPVPTPVPTSLTQSFREQMAVYRSYWRSDPQFDRSQLQLAVRDIPCPEVDRAMLVRLAKYALRTNFGWPRPRLPSVETWEDTCLRRWIERGRREVEGSASLTPVGLQVNGPGGGQWTLQWDRKRIIAAQRGLLDGAMPTLYFAAPAFQYLAAGAGGIQDLLDGGSVLVEGENLPRAEVLRLLDELRGHPE